MTQKKPDDFYVYFQDEQKYRELGSDADPARYWRGEEPTNHTLPPTQEGAIRLAKLLEMTGVASKHSTRIYRRTEIVREGGLWGWSEEPI